MWNIHQMNKGKNERLHHSVGWTWETLEHAQKYPHTLHSKAKHKQQR